MQGLRKVIRKILLEKQSFQVTDSSGAGQEGEFDFSAVDDVLNIISSANVSSYGYNMVSATQPENASGAGGTMQVEVVLQHVKPDFGKFIDELVARGGKFATIYGDTPGSKTKITRWLTGYKEGSEIDARQKSAAIKVAQLAGLEAIQPTLDAIESKYDVTCVANFTGAKTNKKGQSFFEVFVMPPYTATGEVGPTTEQPATVPVDGEVVAVPQEPAPIATPKPKNKKKPRNSKKLKMPKLSSDQKKKGYNRINQQGHVRHVASRDELDTLEDHIVTTVLGTSQGPQETHEPSSAHDLYKSVREAEGKMNTATGTKIFRVVDDYYNEALPILKFYNASVYKGKIKSRSMMSQYTSVNSNQKEGTVAQHSTGEWVKGMVADPNYGRSFADEDFGDYTPPKLGGKEAKDARRTVAKERASDEIIIYAKIEPKINRFSNKISSHTGKVTLYVFLIDRNFA
jgi:hypothetical protein